MNTETLDQYPSTYDLPLIAGGQDAVLAILEGARKRYARSMSTDEYIAKSGAVCAVGAIGREDGLSYSDVYGEFGIDEFVEVFEARASDAAKEAIRLLDEVAIELYPDDCHTWNWALEGLNQNLDHAEAKKAVLRCYDLAIERRQSAVAV